MGLVQYFEAYGIDFYEPIPDKLSYSNPVVGQICWAPILHIDTIPRIFEVERHNPEQHYYVNYLIRNMRPDDFKGKGKLPVKLLNLREKQEAIIHGASKRPCILLHYGETIYPDLGPLLKSLGRAHLQRKNNMLLLPLYGIEDDAGHAGGFPPIMVARIRAMFYDQFLFLPTNAKVPLKDCVGRLDNLQVLVNHHPACDFKAYKVTDDVFSVIISMLKRWFNLELDEEFNTLVEICNEACPEEALPKIGEGCGMK